jgi:hypothetical protein
MAQTGRCCLLYPISCYLKTKSNRSRESWWISPRWTKSIPLRGSIELLWDISLLVVLVQAIDFAKSLPYSIWPSIDQTWSIFPFADLLLVRHGVYSHSLTFYWSGVERFLAQVPILWLSIGQAWSILQFPDLQLVRRGDDFYRKLPTSSRGSSHGQHWTAHAVGSKHAHCFDTPSFVGTQKNGSSGWSFPSAIIQHGNIFFF